MKEKPLTFEKAFSTVMDREFGCTIMRSTAVLQMVEKEIRDFYLIENRLLRQIDHALKEGNVIDEHGGMGDEDFVLYFKKKDDTIGIVPFRFFKKADSLNQHVIKSLTKSWESIMMVKCGICNFDGAALEIHYNVGTKKYEYNVVWCEKCNKIFFRESN